MVLLNNSDKLKKVTIKVDQEKTTEKNLGRVLSPALL
jgi:hypothetical protein